MRVGFIGLGRMGSGMAINLVQAGHAVTVYNRTRAKAEALAARGAKIADRPADACRGDVVFSMLADDAAVESVLYGEGGVLASLGNGAIHISSSTISVALSKRLAAAHAKSGQRYLAAPVFGRPDVAAAGQLYVVAAGAPDALQTAMPLLNAISQRTFAVSEKAEAANLIKLSGNFLIAVVIESLRGGNGPGRQRRGRQAPIPRHPNIDVVRRRCLQNLWRVHRRRQVRAGRFCSAPRTEGYTTDACGCRGSARAPAARKSLARSLHHIASSRW